MQKKGRQAAALNQEESTEPGAYRLSILAETNIYEQFTDCDGQIHADFWSHSLAFANGLVLMESCMENPNLMGEMICILGVKGNPFPLLGPSMSFLASASLLDSVEGGGTVARLRQ